MDLIHFLEKHAEIFCLFYFLIGFAGFYLSLWWDDLGSFNGFWGDLFVAMCWGILWPMLLLAFGIVLPLHQLIEDRTGVYVNISNAGGAIVFCWLTAYSGAAMWRHLLAFDFRGTLTSLFWLSVFLFLFYRALRGINQKPSLPNWAKRGIDETIARHELAKTIRAFRNGNST